MALRLPFRNDRAGGGDGSRSASPSAAGVAGGGARVAFSDAPAARLCLVASSGGHLLELMSLRPAWEGHDRYWVSFARPDAVDLLHDEPVVWAHYPTNRNVRNLLRNCWLAWRNLRRERPDVVISTGAGVAVPFIWVARVLGIKTVYVESLTRIHELSLTGRLVYPVTSGFFVQWPELAERYPRALFSGRIL